MNDFDDGGPAFMVAELANIKHDGMTLRDYFAAKAMQAVVSRGLVPQVPLEIYADNAYKMADAMLKARQE